MNRDLSDSYSSAAAKRLPCVLAIPSGQVEHQGTHRHSTDQNAAHFCETRYTSSFYDRPGLTCHRYRCENCGYYCVLPLGMDPVPLLQHSA
jgi:hypothetical protein